MTRRDRSAVVPLAAARLDAWLWHARVLSTRSACARLVSERGVRVNGQWTDKPGARIRPGDIVTFAVGARVRVLRVVDLGGRREPAVRAMLLYDELAADP
jgi:ribosome-associated heat shock protein Hsp15